MMIASRSDGYSRYRHTNSKRSMFHSLTRVRDLHRSTTSCWRKMRFSASSRARRVNHDRVASSSWVRNTTIGRFFTIPPPARHTDKVFGRHTIEDHWPTLQGGRPSGLIRELQLETPERNSGEDPRVIERSVLMKTTFVDLKNTDLYRDG